MSGRLRLTSKKQLITRDRAELEENFQQQIGSELNGKHFPGEKLPVPGLCESEKKETPISRFEAELDESCREQNCLASNLKHFSS